MEIRKLGSRWYLACLGLGLTVICGIYATTQPVDEVVLSIGEPYEQVRQQSRSTLPAIEPNAHWGGYVSRPARLRFVDRQYGFVSPVAKFLVVNYDNKGNVDSVTLSPQVATLHLDDAMAILVDLQDQLRRGGWKPFRVNRSPPIEDTRITRAQIRRCDAPTSYWQGGANYQVLLNIRCFRSDNRPNDERYLITLDLGPPVFGELPSE
jgi:hypothetical protein